MLILCKSFHILFWMHIQNVKQNKEILLGFCRITETVISVFKEHKNSFLSQ